MLNLNNENINLEFVKNLSWQEVFEIWRQNEGDKPGWQETAKNKGYENWEAWRINYFEDSHRCCALALTTKENKSLNHKIFIALAQYPGEKLPEMVSFDKNR